jgi:drug/metabolite transporter (DMT)-like permease
MTLAVFSRISFIFLNNNLLKIPRLASISTTLTTFITLLSLIFIVLANYYFLGEKLNQQQIIGAGIILIGVSLMLK